MERQAFVEFVERALEETIQTAERAARNSLPRRVTFQWLGDAHPRITENIAEYIAQRVYVDPERIRPSVDLAVHDVLEDGSVLIVGIVFGHPPTVFGRNRTGRDGPFIYAIGGPFLRSLGGKNFKWADEV
jgi:hypothetical protein